MKKIGLLFFVLLSMVVLAGSGFAQQNKDTVNHGGFDTTFHHGKINIDSLIRVQDSIRHVQDSLIRLKHGNDSLPPNHGGRDTLPPNHGGRDTLPPNHGGKDSLIHRGHSRLDSLFHSFDSLSHLKHGGDSLPPHHHLDSLPPNHHLDSLPPNHGGKGNLDSLIRRFDSLYHKLHGGDSLRHHGIDTINLNDHGRDDSINPGHGKDTTINTGGGKDTTTINTGGGKDTTTINTGGGKDTTTIHTGGGKDTTTINTGGGKDTTTIKTVTTGLDSIILHGPPVNPIKIGALDSILHHKKIGPGAIIVPKPVYPNPVVGSVGQVTQEYSIQSDADVIVSISDGSGIIVRQVSLGHIIAGEYSTPLNVSGLSQGTYYVRIQTGTTSVTQKLVVM